MGKAQDKPIRSVGFVCDFPPEHPNPILCGGLLVFAQIISNIKTPKSWKDVDFGVFCV